MTNVTQILYVDYQELMLQTLPPTLERQTNFRIGHIARSAFQALEILREIPYKIVLLEPKLPDKDGIDLIKELLNHGKDLRILILSVDETPIHAYRMMRAGAAGWLSKTASFEVLREALQTVADNKVFLPNTLKTMFAEKYIHPEGEGDPKERLTDREYQVTRLLAAGQNNHEIAERLFIGVKTVDTHRANLLRKLGLRNNADIARFAIQHSLIEV